MKAAVVVFAGTNCELETKLALEASGFCADYVDSNTASLKEYDAVFLCGGFSYGDYIRSGRLAKFTPVIDALDNFIENQRGVVAGICNGFQILCEARMLPGALLENDCLKFVCKNIPLRLDFNAEQKDITLPVAHREGRYWCDEDVGGMVFLKYIQNPNGSKDDIAGLYDKNRRIMGLMPHPERAFFTKNFGFDGREIFKIIKEEIARG